MLKRPSEPLLAFLREALRKKGFTVATLAAQTGLDRRLLKQQLAGAEPLTVDDLILVSNALELDPTSLAGQGVEAESPETESPETGSPDAGSSETEPPPGNVTPLHAGVRRGPFAVVGRNDALGRKDEEPPEDDLDPDGNLPMQLMKTGFALAVDLFVIFDARQLSESGVPQSVLARFKEQLPIRLEARHHRHNRPQYDAEGFTCALSFDRLYTCTFPWTSFKQIHFLLPDMDAPPAAPEPPKPSPGSHLRVVK